VRVWLPPASQYNLQHANGLEVLAGRYARGEIEPQQSNAPQDCIFLETAPTELEANE
jgi:hypothetical protein